MVGKIDVHTHAIPDFFRKAIGSLSQDATGVPQVQWSMDLTRQTMIDLDIATSILSLSAPGPEISPDIKDARSIARRFNKWAVTATKAEPSRFGFFAAVPGPHDAEGCLAEIRHAYDELHADGICLFTSYGGKYLGDPSFEPIWKELNERNAVVFIHPTIPKGYHVVDVMLQPPAFDFTHETGRASAHLIMTGMKRRYSKIKFILSYAGGSLPLLSERLAQIGTGLFRSSLSPGSPQTAEAIVEDAKSFYFDLALAGTANVLDSLLKWAPKEHLVYGSDYPYATTEAVYNTQKLEEYPISTEDRNAYYAGNRLKLFPRLKM